MKKWHVSGTRRWCDCGRHGHVITDHRGYLYGCRPTHAEAMSLAQRKTAKHYDRELNRA